MLDHGLRELRGKAAPVSSQPPEERRGRHDGEREEKAETEGGIGGDQ